MVGHYQDPDIKPCNLSSQGIPIWRPLTKAPQFQQPGESLSCRMQGTSVMAIKSDPQLQLIAQGVHLSLSSRLDADNLSPPQFRKIQKAPWGFPYLMTSLVLHRGIDTCHFLEPEYAISDGLASKEICILQKAVFVAAPCCFSFYQVYGVDGSRDFPPALNYLNI